MEITSVKLSLAKKSKYKFKGYAKIVIDDKLMISGIRLYEDGEKDYRRYILFPDRKIPRKHSTKNKDSVAIVNTSNDELRNDITNAIFTEYDNIIKHK